jgi:hypothetical protein
MTSINGQTPNRRNSGLKHSDRGSIAPLGIGLAIFSLTLIFVILASSSLFIFQKRLKNYSEGIALYVAETGESAQAYLDRVGAQNFQNLKVSSRFHPDGLTVQANSCARWTFPVPTLITSGSGEICAQASARLE